MAHVSTVPECADDISLIWQRYHETRTQADRNSLLTHFLPLVKFSALRLCQRRNGQVEMDDLMQWGVFGLRDAIASFDPARGVKFETYCAPRVRGAMLDGLKSLHWAPRDVRSRLQKFNQALDQVSMELGPDAHPEAVAQRMGVSNEEYAAVLRDTLACNVASLHAPRPDARGMRAVEHVELLADPREESAENRVQLELVKELFLKELTRNERLVMILYYYEDMTMREVGETLGISGTRVSQMHTEIIERLRDRLSRRALDARGRRQPSLDL